MGTRRRREKALTPATLSKLPPGMHCDGGGLYLTVSESGARSWILRTRIRGKRCDVGLGGLSYVSLAEARDEAAKLRARAKKGEDIVAERRLKKRSVPTFEEATKSVHKEVAPTLRNEANKAGWLRSLEIHTFPVFGKKTVDNVDSADVLRAVAPIWTKTPDMARKTLTRIRRVMDWATIQGYRNVMAGNITIPLPNPCAGVHVALPRQPNEGSHAALPYPDLPEFMTTLRGSSSGLAVKLAMEFTILTAARTSEVLNARWEEIDFKGKMWSVPAERMKMEREHRVPLSNRCLEILKALKRLNDKDVVFPSSKPGTPLSNTAMLMALRRMGRGDLTVHGFRATFKTWAEEKTKFDTLVIEASMAHQVKGIERHYLRTTFFEERKKLMDAWATYATSTPTVKVAGIRGYG